MQFETIKGRDYVTMGHSRLEIDRLYFSNPDEASVEIIHRAMDLLQGCRTSFSIVLIGDSRFILTSYEVDEGHAAQLCEVRDDEHGMKFESPLPRAKGNAALPIIQIIREPTKANVMNFSAPVPYGSVAEMVLASINNEFGRIMKEQGSIIPPGFGSTS